MCQSRQLYASFLTCEAAPDSFAESLVYLGLPYLTSPCLLGVRAPCFWKLVLKRVLSSFFPSCFFQVKVSIFPYLPLL